MYVKYHVLFSLPLLLYGLKIEHSLIYGMISYLAAVLIDVDHYLAYIVIKKDFSLKNAIEYYEQEHPLTPYIFHTVYFLAFLYLLKSIIPIKVTWIVNAFLRGLAYHITLDIIYACIVILRFSPLLKLGTKTEKENRFKILKEVIYRLFLINIENIIKKDYHFKHIASQ